MGRPLILSGVLSLHLAVAVLHGASHGLLGVALPAWQNVLVLLTTFIGPVLGLVLAHRGHRWGIPVFTVSMGASLLLGGLLHFIIENPDHVAAIPTGLWHAPFQISAAAVGITAATGALAGGWTWLIDGW